MDRAETIVRWVHRPYDWSTAKVACTSLGDDWRLPTVTELTQIVHFGTKFPTIDETTFPNTGLAQYWSSNAHALYYANVAWPVSFAEGYTWIDSQSTAHYVRCVQGKAVSAKFRDNGNGTVTDWSSNLTWQQCTAPSSGTDCSAASPTLYMWEDALDYCNTLTLGGHSDWRLPNVKSLQSILDVTKATDPSIETEYFPDTQPYYYWSSTTSEGTFSYAWYVNFGLTSMQIMRSGISKTEGQYVRCVRGG